MRGPSARAPPRSPRSRAPPPPRPDRVPAGARMSETRQPSPGERRRNPELRELLDELLTHVRTLSRAAREMSDAERSYAQQRLEWLADEIWRVSTESGSGR